jgi:Uncharacterized protein conserved in archaea
MSDYLKLNREYAKKLKSIMRLRGEPVAVKLVREGEDYPECTNSVTAGMSHCQAIFRAKEGECIRLPAGMQNCHVGASVLGMLETPEKVVTGEFHGSMGMHDSDNAAGAMISSRMVLPLGVSGEAACPLEDADFAPDVVILIDLPERIYWVISLMTAEKGGRATFNTAPFQCTCEDITTIPMLTGSPNISLGCFGCRKRTEMSVDEVVCGIPYALIPGYIKRLERYEGDIMQKARRD